MSDSPIPYARHALDEDDIAAVAETLRGDWLTTGPTIAAFEAAVAARVGARHAVAYANGTAALHAACFAAGVGPGDEIVTAPITFAASGNCALFLGADVRFCDVRADTLTLDPAKLEAAMGPRTRALVAVDFTGLPADWDEIAATARTRGVATIADAAHSLGATYRGRPVGGLADMTAFSFHAVKHIALGEGGMVATDEDRYAERLRLFRTHGIVRPPAAMRLDAFAADNEPEQGAGRNPPTPAPWYYEMQMLGFNYRITDFQCALGLSQLKKLDRFLARRRAIAARYGAAFAGHPAITLPAIPNDREPVWHLYMIRLDLGRLKRTRRAVVEGLRARGIGAHVHYIPLHLQPHYRERYGHRRGDFPVAEAFYDRAVTLPLYHGMTDAEVERVIDAVRAVAA